MKALFGHIYRYRHLLVLMLGTFLSGVLLGWLLFNRPMQAELVQMQQELDRLQGEHRQVLREIAAKEVDNRVLRNSKTSLRRSLEEQKTAFVAQEKQLDFFRQLMVNDSERSGLELNDYSLMPLSAQDTYLYRFTFVQYAQNHDQLQANLSIELQGLLHGELMVYSLQDLVVDEPVPNLDFKYFQVIEGRLQLPQDFEPQSLMLRALRDSRNASPWEQELEWQIKEQ